MTASVFGQQATSLQQIREQAMSKLREAVLSHPGPLVREKLLSRFVSGEVLFVANEALPEMSTSQEDYKGRKQVLLWYNIDFLLKVPNVFNLEDKQAYLWLVLYHEAVHIDDHFSGTMLLGPLFPTAPVSKEQMANDTWDKEWSAVTKEWELAKKLGKPYLVPFIYGATKGHENPLTFLTGFYLLQMSGGAIAFNPALGTGFTARYKEELEKLPN